MHDDDYWTMGYEHKEQKNPKSVSKYNANESDRPMLLYSEMNSQHSTVHRQCVLPAALVIQSVSLSYSPLQKGSSHR